ncbi:hypothetical protein ACJX0J_028255, partial [Zea mays]
MNTSMQLKHQIFKYCIVARNMVKKCLFESCLVDEGIQRIWILEENWLMLMDETCWDAIATVYNIHYLCYFSKKANRKQSDIPVFLFTYPFAQVFSAETYVQSTVAGTLGETLDANSKYGSKLQDMLNMQFILLFGK